MPTAEPTPIAQKRFRLAKKLLLVLIVVCLFLGSGTGGYLRHHTAPVAAAVAGFVEHHPISSPLIYFAIYVTLAVLALPVWWLQILAGIGLGLIYGVALSVTASATGATLTVMLGRWLAGDWLTTQTQGKLDRFDKIADAMGHNGLLVVTALRATHTPIPFGISNYAIALTKITLRDVFIGTLLGNIPAVSLYVGTGVYGNPFHRHPVFIATVAAINLALLLPIGLRYWKPQWFRKVGVE